MTYLARRISCLLLLALLVLPAVSLQAAQPKLKGLLITGGCCHDYARQQLIITEGLSQRINIEWEVVFLKNDQEAAEGIYAKKDWCKGYDLVVHNECYAKIADPAFIDNVVAGHRDLGVPAVFIHCALHTFRDSKSDEWRKLLGVTSRRHEQKRPLVVTPVADHAIMTNFPAEWTTPNGELYVINNVWPTCTPLAKAHGVGSDNSNVVMWANEYGKCRVFGTSIGHHNESMLEPVWLDTLTRGALWACDKLTEAGEPADGYAGSGVAPFSFQTGATGTPTAADWSASVKFPKSEKPVELFNGKDFTGWQGHTDKYFSIDGNTIVAKNTAENAPKVSTYLLTKKDYRNFRLVFESKLIEEKSKMHSGIALWGKQYETGGEPFSYQGHLVMHPSGWGFYDLYRRNSIYRDDGTAKKADNHDWNKIEILAIGNRIRQAVNGKLVADWEDPKPELCQPGPLGLQLHSNKTAQEVRFRGLILAEDPEDRMITVK
jgi:hypothetical protein